MNKDRIRGKDLKPLGIRSSRFKGLIIDLLSKNFKHSTKKEKLEIIKKVLANPEEYLEDAVFSPLVELLVQPTELDSKEQIKLLEEAGAFHVFGRKLIDSNAYQQMEVAMKLPVAVKGALMPDAHHGYGLPIGGVLATKNAVIPYGVGVDIGCRMSLSIFDMDEKYLYKNSYQFKTALKERTCFGAGGELPVSQEHEILDRSEFNETPLLKQLHGKAVKQLGTSGSGNHFVEFGSVNMFAGNGLGLEPGEYIGLLSHSGSRGLGASIAKYYTNLAMEKCLLPKHAQHLAWLDLDSEEGMEYWRAMNLAGDYAKACHDQIHYHLSRHLGIKAIATVENHHNFAWKVDIDDEGLVVHRKGATPAGEGEFGVIPGSMASPGYIVKGKGEANSLLSASHGAGRKMSRQKARQSYTQSELKKVLSQKGVTLIGGGLDEAPVAYKDLEEVMRYQDDLVEAIGSFTPKIVRMDKG